MLQRVAVEESIRRGVTATDLVVATTSAAEGIHSAAYSIAGMHDLMGHLVGIQWAAVHKGREPPDDLKDAMQRYAYFPSVFPHLPKPNLPFPTFPVARYSESG